MKRLTLSEFRAHKARIDAEVAAAIAANDVPRQIRAEREGADISNEDFDARYPDPFYAGDALDRADSGVLSVAGVARGNGFNRDAMENL